MIALEAAKAQAAALMGDPSPRGIVYRAVRSAADRGEAAPSNRVLADLCGLASVSGPPVILAALQIDGAIDVLRGNQERRVAITATGKVTAVPPGFIEVPRAERARRGAAISAARRTPAYPGPSIDPTPGERLRDTATARGSKMLREAMESSGIRARRLREARRSSSLTSLPLERPTPVLRAALAVHRPTAPGRDPCPRCGARGDIGCTHFAPCDMAVPA